MSSRKINNHLFSFQRVNIMVRTMLLLSLLLTCQARQVNVNNWNADADVPLEPNTGTFVEWYIIQVSNLSHSPPTSAMLFLDGSQDDGTIWAERKISVNGTGVTLSLWLSSSFQSEASFCDVVAYVGASNPEFEEEFVSIGSCNQVAGWKRYTYTANIPSATDMLWVAVGINVYWETPVTYYMDEIQ